MRAMSTTFVSSVALILSLSACSVAKNDDNRASRFAQSPFATTYIDKPSVVRVGSVVVLDSEWSENAQACREHFDVTKKLDQVFRAESRVNIVPSSAEDLSPRNASAAISTSGADGAIGVNLVRCTERLGSSFGASEPAQLGFLINLYDRNGKVIWTGTFSMKDQAIFDNLFTAGEKLKVGTGWVTATQILDHGLTLAAREFENQRTGLFLNSAY